MLINLSIASLYASSFSNSPIFSMKAQYSIKSCRFIKMFPIIFFQTPKLNVFNSNFEKLQSEIIIVESVDYIEKSFTDADLANFQKNENVNFVRCIFRDVGRPGSTITGDTTFTECLFYRISIGDSQSFFELSPPKLSINGCCFSEINKNSASVESQGSLFKYLTGNQITLDSNIITSLKALSFIFTTESDASFSIQCKNCNFSSNTFYNTIEFNSPNVDLQFQDTQFKNNDVTSIILINSKSGNFNLASCFFINGNIKASQIQGHFGSSCALFYVFCPSISITDSVFFQVEKVEISSTLTLFAQLRDSMYANVIMVNNRFSTDIFNFISYQYVQASDYTNNNKIYGEVATTVMPINNYLYKNYREECNVYIYPTTQFTASNDFTPSNVFSSSISFSESNIITPTQSNAPTVNAAYGVIGAFGTAIVSFGISSLIWLSIRKFCIYDHNNYFHMDV